MMMKFLIKIEDAVNSILLSLGTVLLKFIPKSIITSILKIKLTKKNLVLFFKELPSLIKAKVSNLRDQLSVVDLKTRIKVSIAEVRPQSEAMIGSKWKELKTNLSIPFYLIAQWLKGLTATQSLVLLSFTAGSFLAGISIVSSGQRILSGQSSQNRSPASVEEIVEYDRPVYYKKTSRHLEITGLRLPVYQPKLNELAAVDVDFTVTLSNRQTRKYLAAMEFQLRDHLILEIEPVGANFPLGEEGKEILRVKLLSEINAFLKLQNIEGEAIGIEITYILAN